MKGKKLIFSSVLLITIFSIFAFSSPGQRYFEIAKNLEIFATLFKEVNAMYVDEVNPNETIKVGIDAMLASLDPYTNYIPEDQIEDYRTMSTGQYAGIGAVTGRMNGKIKIMMLVEGHAAQNNGLRIGDEVIKIDGIDVTNMNNEEIGELMKGQANTSVSLTVLRYGHEDPLTLDFKREKVKIKNVPYHGMVSNDIGYIKQTQFTMQAGKEVSDALNELKEKGAKKIILDLRGNPGGLLMEAVNITNVFIPKGKEVVSTKGKLEEHNSTYKTLNSPDDTEIPIAVLINSGSASASEIVAGTIQDYDRGVIIGEKSFGKGLVQQTRPLSYNAQLKVTTAKYYTPSGRCIQALDYSHRNNDGSVGKVPDSLKVEFFTQNHRSVYDGGGIDPDIEVEHQKIAPISLSLYSNGLIFDYASKYHAEHDKIAPAKDFELSDAEYEEFTQWLKGKDYGYTTDAEKTLKDLTEYAHEEKYYSEIEGQLKALKSTLMSSKSNDLYDFKNQLKTILEEEITSRYYLENGSIESTFDHDTDIKTAKTILNDSEKYNKILKLN
ncbi:S41 family peptidase [Fulvivirga sediminis]|uniref:S41 family peptidase n=1 Tax=Fulvivirga sediminis TaxID=2803949 RepID=A0A937K336_9BACT|nr:S41 family peptidase [Fulvivirga sediminis]MBL3658542.1 S41 family peptidase [Fulvivirga sediminis]